MPEPASRRTTIGERVIGERRTRCRGELLSVTFLGSAAWVFGLPTGFAPDRAGADAPTDTSHEMSHRSTIAVWLRDPSCPRLTSSGSAGAFARASTRSTSPLAGLGAP